MVYESTGVTDPAALRTEATAVMSAFLKAQPGIRANFHGLWAYAEKDGKRTPVMELPMKQDTVEAGNEGNRDKGGRDDLVNIALLFCIAD